MKHGGSLLARVRFIGRFLYIYGLFGQGGDSLVVAVRIVAVADCDIGDERKCGCHVIRHLPRIIADVAHIFVAVKWYFGKIVLSLKCCL